MIKRKREDEKKQKKQNEKEGGRKRSEELSGFCHKGKERDGLRDKGGRGLAEVSNLLSHK